MRKDAQQVQEEMTEKFITLIEEGIADPKGWKKPWKNIMSGMATRATGFYQYTGMNQLFLSMVANMNDWSNLWATTSQWKKIAKDTGIKLDWRGQHCETEIFRPIFSQFTKDDEDKDGKPIKNTVRFVKNYDCHLVMNASQIKGTEQILADLEAADELKDHEPIDGAEKFISGIKHTINHGSNRAYYKPSTDSITMPELGQFDKPEGYYATYLHELTHWTGHESRENRLTSWARDEYAKEELVAELGSALLCQYLNIDGDHIDNHANYMANWLQVLKNDTKFITQASGKAFAAYKLLRAEAGQPVPESGK